MRGMFNTKVAMDILKKILRMTTFSQGLNKINIGNNVTMIEIIYNI